MFKIKSSEKKKIPFLKIDITVIGSHLPIAKNAYSFPK